VLRLESLAVEQESARFAPLGAVRRWGSADWKDRTTALR
jgi:hypothetical protein